MKNPLKVDFVKSHIGYGFVNYFVFVGKADGKYEIQARFKQAGEAITVWRSTEKPKFRSVYLITIILIPVQIAFYLVIMFQVLSLTAAAMLAIMSRAIEFLAEIIVAIPFAPFRPLWKTKKMIRQAAKRFLQAA